MKIAISKETKEYERRVAASPETVKKMVGLGFEVSVESGAGNEASFSDEAYSAVGSRIVKNAKTLFQDADVILKVQPPLAEEIDNIKSGATLIGLLQPYAMADHVKLYREKKITTFALELVPRITRAQSMDVLSSQSNLAGYRAVIDAAAYFSRAFPMMMTAAGTIAPARVLVIGAGVAGLQAIATAKRLGAIVSAFDVRAAAKEQVESLGATFVEVAAEETGEATGGYAKEMSKDYQKRQAEKLQEVLAKTDIVICTALIPGKPAPRLITSDMMKRMKSGSVIVDLAVEMGGNCEGSKLGQVIVKDGISILGYANVPSRVATDASALYSKNVLNFLMLIFDKENKKLSFNWDDEILTATALTHEGKAIHPLFKTEN